MLFLISRGRSRRLVDVRVVKCASLELEARRLGFDGDKMTSQAALSCSMVDNG